MKVKFVFPFIKADTYTEGKSLKIFSERVDLSNGVPPEVIDLYENWHITSEYFIGKGITNPMLNNTDDLRYPIIEYEDQEKVSPRCFAAFCELVFTLFPYMIEKITQVRKKRESMEGMADLGRRNILGQYLIDGLFVPLLDVSSSHDEMFEHFNRLISNSKFSKFQNALLYWKLSYERENFIDSLLDLAIAIESLFSVSDEQSLKIPIFVFHFLDKNRHHSLITIYKLYQYRNIIMHGNSLPNITVGERFQIIEVVAEILLAVLKMEALPNVQLLEKRIYELYHD